MVLTDYRDMSLADKIASVPGQLMTAAMKPLDIINWITGGRAISRTTEELTREGAYVASKKRGETDAQAQRAYDYSTGDYGGKAGNANLAALIRVWVSLIRGLEFYGVMVR